MPSGNRAIQIWHLIDERPLLAQNGRLAKRRHGYSITSFGAGEQKMRDCDLAELTRREESKFPEGNLRTRITLKLSSLALMQPEDSVHGA